MALGIYVNNKAVVPSEIIKRSTFPEVNNVTRCSDIVTSMLNTCPAMFKPHLKNKTLKMRANKATT